MAQDEEQSLTELERRRLERIAQNRARLEALELPKLAASIADDQQREKEAAKASKEAKYRPDPSTARRTSSRAAAAAAAARLKEAARSTGDGSSGLCFSLQHM